MRVIRSILKALAVLAVACFLARLAIVSGLVKSLLETSVGNAMYMKLHHVFNVNGLEEAEDVIVSVVLIVSLLLISMLAWLLSKFMARKPRSEV
ncbi:hypothetical protein [Pseudomonas syringae]|uniref:hypothetical protein n=1 Tax=Pseudomonas syringae TaxID=317 RepID=UPI000E32527C|nr:hypothetical protein [Pseudomonas syringae]